MANDDELITDPERVTGEYAALQGKVAEATDAWVAHYETCQFFCQRGNSCAEGQRLTGLLIAATAGKGGQA